MRRIASLLNRTSGVEDRHTLHLAPYRFATRNGYVIYHSAHYQRE